MTQERVQKLVDVFKTIAEDVGIEPALGVIYTFVKDTETLNAFSIQLKALGVEFDDSLVEYIGKSFGELLLDLRDLDVTKAKAKTSKEKVRNTPVSKLKWVHRPKERSKLKKEGKVKFLGKNKDGKPCCPYTNKDGSMNCRMLKAAESRASQNGYTKYAEKAKRLYEEHCKKKPTKKA